MMNGFRQNQDIAMRNLFQKARLVSFLIESYLPYPGPNEPLPKNPSDDFIKKMSCRGVIMNCVNAVRLQVCFIMITF
jgi:hypothetical protein